MGLVSLEEEETADPSLSLPCEHAVRRGPRQFRKWALTSYQICQHHGLGRPHLWTCEKYTFGVCYPVSGVS